MNIAVKVAGAFGLLGMLVAAVLITKFYFIDEWYEPEWRRHERNYESNCTLVTALFTMGNQRPPNENGTINDENSLLSSQRAFAFQWALERHHAFLRLLLLLRMPIVVFTDAYTAKFVEEVRHSIGMANVTKIWNMTLAELPLQANASLFHAIIDDQEPTVNGQWNDQGWNRAASSDYRILVHSKSYFLQNVSSDNPFNASSFVWLDASYGHGQPDFFPLNFEWQPRFPAKKISLLKLSPTNDSLHSYQTEDLYHRDVNLISTDFLAGDSEAIGEFHSLFQQKVLMEATKEGIFDDDDQTIMVLLIKENWRLFNLIGGRWFNAFHLF